MGLNAIFSELALTTGDHIKSQTLFSDYYLGYGFFGGLKALTTDTMYAVKVTGSAALIVSGTPVALPKSVTFNSGWNFLPCPYQTSRPLVDSVPTFTYTTGSQLKSQMEFAEYYEGFGFYGTLTNLQPGLGYKLKVSVGGPATFKA
uniref:Uncharacterized protein n=1 Tax=Haptolina ericina TaxID=156174 RepID=A0A7S3ANW4_9EUKA